jgi:hypothetical protein
MIREIFRLQQGTASKLCCGFLVILSFLGTSAQNRYDWRSHIDFIMHQTDSLSLRSQRTFFLTKYLKNDQPFKETWYYTLNEGRIIIFEVRYLLDSTEFSETYYLDKDRLVCMEQYETARFSFYEDEIKRGKVFLVADNSIKQYVTVGYQNNDYAHRLSDIQPIDRFQKRYSELRKHLPIVTPR